MNKKLWMISTLALSALLSVTAFAADAQKKAKASDEKPARRKSLHEEFTGQGYGMAGCGLGSVVFGEQPGKIQIISATINSTAGSQTFGISSGTSNCTDTMRTANAGVFIEVNRVALESDIARGQGETIAHLSAIMECQDSAAVAQKFQQNFSEIFPQQGVPAEKVTEKIKSLINKDKALGCKRLG